MFLATHCFGEVTQGINKGIPSQVLFAATKMQAARTALLRASCGNFMCHIVVVAVVVLNPRVLVWRDSSPQSSNTLIVHALSGFKGASIVQKAARQIHATPQCQSRPACPGLPVLCRVAVCARVISLLMHVTVEVSCRAKGRMTSTNCTYE